MTDIFALDIDPIFGPSGRFTPIYQKFADLPTNPLVRVGETAWVSDAMQAFVWDGFGWRSVGLSPLVRSQDGLITPNGDQNGVSAVGIYAGATTTGTVVADGDMVYGMALEMVTAATIGADAGVSVPVVFGPHLRRWNSVAIGKFRSFYNTNYRAFVGMADQSLATMVGADNPAGRYVGIQFSSGRGDSTWQWVTKDGTTQVVSASNSAPGPGTKPMYLRVVLRESASSNGPLSRVDEVFLLLLNEKFEYLDSKTFTSNIPAWNDQMGFVFGCEAQAAIARSIYFYCLKGANPI